MTGRENDPIQLVGYLTTSTCSGVRKESNRCLLRAVVKLSLPAITNYNSNSERSSASRALKFLFYQLKYFRF